MTFAAAPEYQVFPTLGRPMKPYEAATAAARDTLPLVRDLAPDVCVSDILTLAPAWAAEACGVPVATLVPHVCPMVPPGFPPFSIGARLPRTRAGARLWAMTDGLVRKGLETGRTDYNAARAPLGLPPAELHTGLSRSLTMVATLPQLEYPRAWPDWMRVVGPLLWEPPGERVAPPPGDGPVVLVAPSTSQDLDGRMLRAALDGVAAEDVRVIAVWGGRRPSWLDGYAVPANAVLVPWLSYAKTMPACDVVVTHGGHGTLARALVSRLRGRRLPGGRRHGRERRPRGPGGRRRAAAQRLLSPATLRLAVRRALAEPRLRARAREVSAWAAAHDAPAVAAGEVERWAARVRAPALNGRP